MTTRPLVFAFALGCQPLTDPCYTFSEDAPDRCAGQIVVDAASDPPTFDVIELGAADPTLVSVVLNNEDPCSGGTSLWELTRFSADDLPLTYGVAPPDAKVWVNPLLSPNGTPVPLETGRSYTVSFYAKNRLARSGMAPTTWSAMFVVGEPDSVQLWDDACLDGP